MWSTHRSLVVEATFIFEVSIHMSSQNNTKNLQGENQFWSYIFVLPNMPCSNVRPRYWTKKKSSHLHLKLLVNIRAHALHALTMEWITRQTPTGVWECLWTQGFKSCTSTSHQPTTRRRNEVTDCGLQHHRYHLSIYPLL